jgi:hypothetical protein
MEKYCSKAEGMESWKVEELTSAKAHIRWVNKAEFRSGMGFHYQHTNNQL